MARRELTFALLDSLKADPANPKAHALTLITDSIGRFGYVEPIVIDERTGYTISGHGRTESLRQSKAAGEPAPEGVVVDDDGDWLVPVIVGWASKNDAEARGALIALNRTGEMGGWEDQQLLALLQELAKEDHGLDGLGYDASDIDVLMSRLVEYEPDDDDDVRLDRQSITTCPECGHEFVPVTRTVTDG